MSHDGADIEPVLEFTQNIGTHVDHSYFVSLFARQMVCRGRADLAGAEN
jgi:hypothetical protein